MDSIVNHKHQLAAYCGIHYFDSDAYPEAVSRKALHGQYPWRLHQLSTTAARRSHLLWHDRGRFPQANDVWFMPVVQKTGPDGCLYVLDWYDRYHCYQDANRDPEGVDRLQGRLYRMRYQNSPSSAAFDLRRKRPTRELIERLHSGNIYFRDAAQRLLAQRGAAETRPLLERLVMDEAVARKTRMHALWALVGSGHLDERFHLQLLRHRDPGFRAGASARPGIFALRGPDYGADRRTRGRSLA